MATGQDSLTALTYAQAACRESVDDRTKLVRGGNEVRAIKYQPLVARLSRIRLPPEFPSVAAPQRGRDKRWVGGLSLEGRHCTNPPRRSPLSLTIGATTPAASP